MHDSPDIEVHFLAQPAGAPITPSDVQQYDALLIKRNPVVATVFEQATSAKAEIRLRLLARNGVGYDHIDVGACNRAGVMISITPEAVARPVASSILAMMLAFSHRLFERDRLTRAGRWADRWNHSGMALTGRTLGVIGLGNIGLEVFRLAAPWKMRHLGYTPRPRPDKYNGLNVELVSLDALFEQSDFVALCCPLNDQTRGLVDATVLGRMRRHAFLINTARGEVIQERALVEALRDGQIAGAGIDVFEKEPPPKDHPLFMLDNVIVGSHNLAYSDELNSAANLAVAMATLSLAEGRAPKGLVNVQVLQHPRLRDLSPQP